MFLDPRKIKHYKNFIEPELADELLNTIKHNYKVADREGSNKKVCSGIYLDFSQYENKLILVKNKVLDTIENYYKVKCNPLETVVIHYGDNSFHKSHSDGQKIVGNLAVPGNDRDLSAVLYLNDDYEGGELFFDMFNHTIKPNKGDLITYPTTFQYTHGVKTVKGNRYVITTWFSSNPRLNVEIKINNTFLRNLILSRN